MFNVISIMIKSPQALFRSWMSVHHAGGLYNLHEKFKSGKPWIMRNIY